MNFITKAFSFLTGGWVGPLLSIGAIVVTLGAGYAYVVHNARSEGRAEIQAQWDKDIQARELLAAAAAEEKRIKEKQHEVDIETERKRREADGLAVGRVLADTRAALERLRSTTATISSAGQAASDPASRPGTEAPPAGIGELFNECSGSLVEMAETTERLGIRLRGLQAWADSALAVCGQ